MKRYILFGFEKYYPQGGMNDFISEHDTKREAVEFICSMDTDNTWVREDTRLQLFDQDERRVIYNAMSRGEG